MRRLAGLREVVDGYDGFILDLWGVLHDGVRPYPGAIDTLSRLRDARKRVVLLSNAPRRAARAIDGLRAMGFDDSLYDGVLTSGEATYRLLAEAPPFGAGRRLFHLGPERDRNVFEGLDYTEAPIGTADFLLNTGPDDLSGAHDIEPYLPALDAARAAGLPMLCANPDLEIVRDGQRLVCAGLLAEHYAGQGGVMRMVGKPDPAVYATVLDMLGVAPTRVLAVGDSLRTDMSGARNAGLDGLWVLGGIHAEEAASPEAAAAAARAASVTPIATVPAFLW